LRRIRLSDPAKADIAAILRASERMHGAEARIRYRALVSAALRLLADNPQNPSTRRRDEFVSGLRSFHLRHARKARHDQPVAEPVHVIYCRSGEPDAIEVVRILHERMEPERRLARGE
jgi:toxin ParE1/3/4